jgi:predicted nucleotidyltransferase
MNGFATLEALCAEHKLIAVYLFGSRAEAGAAHLRGEPVEHGISDLDVGVFFAGGPFTAARLAALQIGLEQLFAPLRVDLVPLDAVDALFQFHAIQGLRIAASPPTAANEKELEVMRRAAELLPFQREHERQVFGVTTS